MAPKSQSWATVEEKLLIDITIWRSKSPGFHRPVEYISLVEGASIMPTGKGVATVRIGKLDWELTPPSNCTDYCETKDDWLLVSHSDFKVAVRTPYSNRLLQVCPRSEEMELLGSQALLPLHMQNLGLREGSLGLDVSINNLHVDDKLSNSLLARFFSQEDAGTSTSPTLRRTILQKKPAEIIGEKFSAPFLRCVSDLQTAKNISDVLETMLGLSAAFDLTQQALLQDHKEEFECDLTGYFYNEQVWEKYCSRKSDSLWVRQQANHAAMKCQTAAAATSEVAKVGARILLDMYIKPPEENKLNGKVVENLSDSEMDECSEVNLNSTISLPFDHDDLMKGSSSSFEDLQLSATRQHWNSEYLGSGAANPDGPSLEYCDQYEIGDLDDSNNPTQKFPRTHSFGSSWESDVGNDSCSESSWEVVQSLKNESNVEDEADVLGAEFSDAESLDMMLRDLDPFGKRDCSPLINEFLCLNMNSATCSSSTDDSDQEQKSYVQEERKTKVLERLSSWSSSNSGSWTDRDILSSASSVKKMRTPQLETLAEELPCDPEIARLYRSFVFRAAMNGNVLQWCSCKFNKLRCSIELKFQVGSFMEDDIATLSTGISRESPLHVEIFLDSTNVRESLLKGNVRVSAHQGVPFGYGGSWNNGLDKTAVLPPVAGLSCYIPHLVRQYLKQEVHVKLSISGYQFPDGELLTGLMKYVVAQLVFIKHSCCVCNHETPSDVLTSVVPRPCEKNLCQALYNAWLVVAPPMVLELSAVVDWLKACFNEDPLHEAFMVHYMTHQHRTWTGSYEEKVQRVAKWLADTKVTGSWLLVSIPKVKIDIKFQCEDSEKPLKGQTNRATKRRKTVQIESPVETPTQFMAGTSKFWQPVSSPPPSPEWKDLEHHHVDMFSTGIGSLVLDDPSTMTTTPQAPKESNVLKPRPLSLLKQKWEKLSASAYPLTRTPPRAQGESSSQGVLEPLSLKEKLFASARPPKIIPPQAQGKLSSQEKRTLPQAQGKSSSQDERIPPQAQEKSSSQDPVPSSWEELFDEV